MSLINGLVYTGPNKMVYQPMPQQPTRAGELLIRVEAAGICGSDMHAYHGHDARRVPPLVLGHEGVGIIANGKRAGQRVALNPLITCGRCRACQAGRTSLCEDRTMLGMTRQGAMAEMVTIPEALVLPVADDVDPVHAALMEPAGCTWHAIDLVKRVARQPLPDQRILIIGAGAIGLLTALILHYQGCREIHLTDMNPLRVETAQNCAVATVHNARETSFSEAFGIVFDAVGTTGTRQAAIEAIRPGGVIMHIGLQEPAGPFNVRKLTLGEIAFLGTYAYTHNDLQASLKLLEAGSLGDLSWVETRPLADGASAFADLDQGKSAAAKIILVP